MQAIWVSRPVLLTAVQTLKKPTMSRPNVSLSKQILVASALALGATGVTLADDSSRTPATGDSHACAHGGQNLGNCNVARAPRLQAANASAARIKKADELTPEQKLRLARAELTITLLRLFSDSMTGQ
jgi:hypothetical protein